MDTTIPDIMFDENGICNYCRGYEEQAGKELLPDSEKLQYLERAVGLVKKSGRNKEYDCVIGVSGGVDSSYLVYKVKEFGLRPLAVHFDNGWNAEAAVANIETLLKKLDVDLYTHVVDWEEFKDLQLAFFRSSIANLEIPTDHALMALLYDIAARHGIRYIVTGSNVVTEAIMPQSWMEANRDLRLLKAIHARFGSRKLKTYPTMGLVKLAYYTFFKGMKHLPLLNYLEYDRKKAIKELEKKFGWKSYGGKHYESVFTRFFQGYILPEKYGIDKRIAHLSTLIMSGQITRNEALEELSKPPYTKEREEEDRVFVLKKLGMSEEEFEKFMNTVPKRGEEYPSTQWVFTTLRPFVNMARRWAKSI